MHALPSTRSSNNMSIENYSKTIHQRFDIGSHIRNLNRAYWLGQQVINFKIDNAGRKGISGTINANIAKECVSTRGY